MAVVSRSSAVMSRSSAESSRSRLVWGGEVAILARSILENRTSSLAMFSEASSSLAMSARSGLERSAETDDESSRSMLVMRDEEAILAGPNRSSILAMFTEASSTLVMSPLTGVVSSRSRLVMCGEIMTSASSSLVWSGLV